MRAITEKGADKALIFAKEREMIADSCKQLCRQSAVLKAAMITNKVRLVQVLLAIEESRKEKKTES